MTSAPLLELHDVRRYFASPVGSRLFGRSAPVRAVDGVSLQLREGESTGLVGESGCGKSTVARLILGLDRPTAGSVTFDGVDLQALLRRHRHRFTSRVQAVFQDPWSSLDPRMRVRDIVAEPLVSHRRYTASEITPIVAGLLGDVGVEPVLARVFPHELSGGQRQRVAIARALALGPSLVVLDEPVSALDVSIRAQVMNLLRDTMERLGLSFFLIAHDLATVRYLCTRLAVMYLGKIVETGPASALLDEPLHPYTMALRAASTPLGRDGRDTQTEVLSGDVPSPADPPSGCRFRTRCPLVFDRCSVDEPLLRVVRPGRSVACHLA